MSAGDPDPPGGAGDAERRDSPGDAEPLGSVGAESGAGGGGRAASGGQVVVIDLGGTYMRFGHLVNGVPAAASWIAPTVRLREGDPVEALAEAVGNYREQERLAPAALVAGVPVSLDAAFDGVLSSPNIPALEGVPLASRLRAALGVEVLLERDIALLLQGEWLAGAGRGAASLLGVFIGTGVGGAFLLDGEPYRGASGGALEIGHIPVRHEGRRCVCGNLDCLEAYASGHRLRELQRSHGVPFEQLFLAPGPPGLTEGRGRVVDDLARAVATAVNLLDPEVVLLGGGIPAMNGFPRGPFEATVRAHLRRPVPAGHVALRWAALGSRAALFGARCVLERRRTGARR